MPSDIWLLGALAEPRIAIEGIRVPDFEDATAVSAMLQGWRAFAVPTFTEDTDVWTCLRNVAADRERRDVLASLSATDVLQSHERTLLHQYALEMGDQAFEATRKLERLWGASNELMAPTEPRLRAIVEEARTLTAGASGSMTVSLLMLAWLRQSVALATVHIDVAAKALLDLAVEKPGDTAVRITKYFEAGDYRSGCGALPSWRGAEYRRRPSWKPPNAVARALPENLARAENKAGERPQRVNSRTEAFG